MTLPMRKTISCVMDKFDGDEGRWLKSWYETGEHGRFQYHSRSWMLWMHISRRCRAGGEYQKNLRSYEGVKNGFIDYQDFASWANDTAGYRSKDDRGNAWHIDKDILSPASGKSYSRDTCCFVPAAINILLITRGNDRGECPLGVHKVKSKRSPFKAQISIDGNEKHIGQYASPMAAHAAWQSAKACVIEEKAKWYASLDGATTKVVDRLMDIAASIRYDLIHGRETFSL